jgi:ABC-2 type transport system permease protein
VTAPAAGTPAASAPAGLGSATIGGRTGFDPGRTRGDARRDGWRGFSTAVRIGWATEANWTDPVLFLIYSVAKPVCAALILVAMLEVIGGQTTRQYRSFVITGSALWAMVLAGISGLALSILDDRERYRMLKYVYVSPASFLTVAVGRSVARVGVGAMGAIITLGVGIVALGVPFDPGRIDWVLLALATVGGFIVITSIGVLLGAIVMQTRQEAWQYPEALAGALFLISGAVFPLAILPSVLQGVGLVVPLTWWIEGTRQALFPDGLSAIGGEGSVWLSVTGTFEPDPMAILVALFATGLVGTLAGMLAFRASERRAKDRGLIDITTGS